MKSTKKHIMHEWEFLLTSSVEIIDMSNAKKLQSGHFSINSFKVKIGPADIYPLMNDFETLRYFDESLNRIARKK